MTSHYEVTVAGRPPEWTAGAIRARFGPVRVHRRGSATVVSGTVCDQSALRALLGLLWDTGAAVVALSVDGSPDPAPGNARDRTPGTASGEGPVPGRALPD